MLPTKKKIGASFNISIENIFLAIGIKPVETNKIPEMYESVDLVMT